MIFFNNAKFRFSEENDKAPSDGRILFKKPSGSKKREKESNSPESDVAVKQSKEKKKRKEKKQEKSLLSFEEVDDE